MYLFLRLPIYPLILKRCVVIHFVVLMMTREQRDFHPIDIRLGPIIHNDLLAILNNFTSFRFLRMLSNLALVNEFAFL